ncbi:patatin family protein [Prevotella sp. HUN102]|uniref:patatin-like phospholipase family protein n=1 Tax=Prevotella sp. HUN102 TaxID=1392486 RepID=UPI00048D5A2C|nr:patatin family protein [Prevotella sp. HUN102]
MEINRNTGLVLEGGGMRGVFTAGVLDAFMKHNLYFHYVVAVSAGACNGLSYMSRQPRRARASNIDLLAKYNYIGVRHLVTQGCIFDPELLYKRFPYEIIPFDYDTFFENMRKGDVFEMVTTNCETGRSEYLQETSGDAHRLNELVRASSSLPYVSKIVNIDGTPMLDGGIADSIPVLRAIETGHEKNIVVCTRNKGWRDNGRDLKQPKFVYRNYPRLRVLLSRRLKAYNEQLDLIDALEAKGDILVIRPENPIVVGRMEKDVQKLEALYEEGFQLGERFTELYA